MAKLTIRKGSDEGAEFSFEGSVVIGRGPTAHVSLSDPTISRHHAKLSWVDNQCYVSDLGSGNGTFVNDARVSEPTRLKDGDVLCLGAVVAEFREEEAGSSSPADEPTVNVVEASPEAPEVLMTMGVEGAEVEQSAEADADDMVAAMSRRLRFLGDLGKVIGETLEEGKLLSFVLEEIFELLPQVERAFVMLWDADAERLVTRAARTRSGEASEITVSRTLLRDVVERLEAILFVQSTAEQYAEVRSLHAAGIRSAICAPILCHEDLYGVIQVDCRYTGRPFGRADMALVLGIASQLGMFLAYSRLHARLLEQELLERDLMLARRIQQQFLPADPPTIGGYTFAVDYHPALAVGGDYYGFFELDDGRIGIAVGDASGKGVSAALYVARMSSDVRYWATSQTSPAEILRRVNRDLSRHAESGMFATLALVALDPRSGELTMANAGHPPPLLRGLEGEVVPLGSGRHPPLGLSADASFEEHRERIEASQSVVLYTDGVSEAEGQDGEMFGEERLRAAIRRSDSAEGILESVLSAVEAFTKGAPQSDDITLVCFGREDSSC